MVAIFDQPAHAVQRVIGQTMNLESLGAIGPAAAQIETRRRFKAQTAIERRIAKRHDGGIAKLVQGIKPFIDQLTPDALTAVAFSLYLLST